MAIGEWAETRRAAFKASLESPGAGKGVGGINTSELRQRLGGAAPSVKDGQFVTAATQTDSDDDPRTLWVDVDEHREQRKLWAQVVRESFHNGWNPGAAEVMKSIPTVLRLLKYFETNGGDPMLWLDKFAAAKGLSASDRVMYELSVLFKAFKHAG